MAWTNVSKPTGTTYTPSNAIGRQQYDQASISYDDATTFYDGINNAAWTNVNKPVSTSWTNIAKPI